MNITVGTITIIGTSHIAKESVDSIKKEIAAHPPDIIAVELDSGRLHALQHENGRRPHLGLGAIRKIGLKGFLFALIGGFAQRKLGAAVGMEPGAEMLYAVRCAQERSLPLALIDQDISVTLSRFSRFLSWKEKFRFLGDLLRALFFQKRELRRLGLEHLDLSKVPADALIERLIGDLKGRYPNVHRTLVDERNHVMVRRLRHMHTGDPEKRILAVVGAGHAREMARLLEEKTRHDGAPAKHAAT